MKDKCKEWEKRFDQEFLEDRKGLSVYAVANDLKSFIHSLLNEEKQGFIDLLEGYKCNERKCVHTSDYDVETYAEKEAVNSVLAEIIDQLKKGLK